MVSVSNRAWSTSRDSCVVVVTKSPRNAGIYAQPRNCSCLRSPPRGVNSGQLEIARFEGPQKPHCSSDNTIIINSTKRISSMTFLRQRPPFTLGIVPENSKKVELIHTIRRVEGHTPCFGKSNGQWPCTDCCFMENCLKVKL